MAGRTSTTWKSGSTWRSGKTTTLRVPQALKEEVMNFALALDQGTLNRQIILNALEQYIQYKSTIYHPNQHSKSLDIKSRAWDELRKFKQMVECGDI